MNSTRRDFLASAFVAASTARLTGPAVRGPRLVPAATDRVDPWIELDAAAYRRNARAVSRLCEGRPVIAVLKNNAYGVGVTEVASVLDGVPEVWGFAVVQAQDALSLRDAGVRKPILLMARHAEGEGEELARAGVTLSVFDDDDPGRLRRLSSRLGKPADVNIYVDTGLGRMGRLHSRMAPWLDAIVASARVTGAFTMLTSDSAFIEEQLRRFQDVRAALRTRGVEHGIFHAASSSPLLHHPASRLDAVRPGILLHGSLPGGGAGEAAMIDLKVAFRLRARVVRLEQLPAGSTIGFSRFYRIDAPTWIATLPIGWGDGYPSAAENGAVVFANGRTFAVVNVNSNHTNILVGSERVLEMEDVVTLIGPDDRAVTPEGIAGRIGGHNYRQIDLKGYLAKVIP